MRLGGVTVSALPGVGDLRRDLVGDGDGRVGRLGAARQDVKATSPTYHPMSWTAHRVDPVGAGGSNNGRLVPAHRAYTTSTPATAGASASRRHQSSMPGNGDHRTP